MPKKTTTTAHTKASHRAIFALFFLLHVDASRPPNPILLTLLCSLITTPWGKAGNFLKWYIHSNDSKNKEKERKEKCINRKGKRKETIK
ncbi:hypothetical protein CI102_6868 [Trichoderma harzianum]|nr:hypothetical protein CI102_6868 [Trichoderma harzianum]